MKYWPNVSNGGSTGFPPIHVSRAQVAMKVQNRSCAGGQKASLWRAVCGVRGRKNRMKMAKNMARTPPSLLGMDRRIV